MIFKFSPNTLPKKIIVFPSHKGMPPVAVYRAGHLYSRILLSAVIILLPGPDYKNRYLCSSYNRECSTAKEQFP